MGEHGRQGRRLHLPEDDTPYAGAYVDVAARIAWLLRVHRLLSPHPDTKSLSDFARRLSAAGVRADAARISRWETAAAPPSTEVLTAYETALGLQAGQLLAVCQILGHSILSRHRNWLTPAGSALPTGHSQRHLDEVYDRVVDGEARGGEWLSFSALLTGAQPALVPGRLVQDLTNRLVDEMSRSVGVAYYTRYEALCQMAAYGRTSPAVARAVTAATRTAGAQSILDAMTLYGEMPHPQMVGRLVYTASHDDARLRLGSVHALLNMVLLGTLPPPTLPQVEDLIVGLVDPRADLPGQRLGQLLGARLLEPSRQRVMRRSGVPIAPPVSPSRHNRELPVSLPRYLEAAASAATVESDPMLARLLREFLAGEFIERQHQAGLMLLASPYRRTIADTALNVVAETDDPGSAAIAVHLLTYVSSAEHVAALRGLISTVEPSLRGGVLRALAHADAQALRGIGARNGTQGDLTLGELATLGIDDVEILYAAGMTGHADLETLSRPTAEPHARRLAAMWWRDRGPALRY